MEWEDPPEYIAAPGKWDSVADELRANPGRWALVGEQISASTAPAIRRGKYVSFRPAGAFEATVRRLSPRGRGDVYARYIGNGTGSIE